MNRFWSQFRAALVDEQLDLRHADWYVRRAREFIESNPSARLKDRAAEGVRAYLARIFIRGKREDWQYGQIVDALRLLFIRFAKPPWAADFP